MKYAMLRTPSWVLDTTKRGELSQNKKWQRWPWKSARKYWGSVKLFHRRFCRTRCGWQTDIQIVGCHLPLPRINQTYTPYDLPRRPHCSSNVRPGPLGATHSTATLGEWIALYCVTCDAIVAPLREQTIHCHFSLPATGRTSAKTVPWSSSSFEIVEDHCISMIRRRQVLTKTWGFGVIVWFTFYVLLHRSNTEIALKQNSLNLIFLLGWLGEAASEDLALPWTKSSVNLFF